MSLLTSRINDPELTTASIHVSLACLGLSAIGHERDVLRKVELTHTFGLDSLAALKRNVAVLETRPLVMLGHKEINPEIEAQAAEQ